jgi:hypothetical protein
VSAKDNADRISRADIDKLISDHADTLSFGQAEVDTFLDRDAFAAYQLLSKVRFCFCVWDGVRVRVKLLHTHHYLSSITLVAWWAEGLGLHSLLW